MSLLVVHVNAEEADLASDWLWMLGATAIEERLDEGHLVAGFADADQALAVRSVIVERWPARFEVPPDESEWRDVWLQHLRPVRVGQLIVHPPWAPPDDAEADAGTKTASPAGSPIALSIDPGRAFGSGHHESTQLALLALEEVSSESAGLTVLDVGCGTGVLSVAAAALGASHVLGIDLDLDIAELARSNARANGQDVPQVNFTTQDITQMDERFDVVVANMTIGTVTPLLDHVARAVGDVLILSGLLHDHLPRVSAQLDRQPVHTWKDGPWVAARWAL